METVLSRSKAYLHTNLFFQNMDDDTTYDMVKSAATAVFGTQITRCCVQYVKRCCVHMLCSVLRSQSKVVYDFNIAGYRNQTNPRMGI